MNTEIKDDLLEEFMRSKDPEKTIFSQADQIIFAHKKKIIIPKRKKEKLNILLAGYVGAGNIGSDIRSYEMIRQFYKILSKNKINLSLMVVAKKFVPSFFNNINIINPKYIPSFLDSEIINQDGVITCEGSLFKSNFSSIISLHMLTALGLASAEKKFSIAYAAEAGKMDIPTKQFATKHCGDTLVICRNQSSQNKLTQLGLRTAAGSDPAWSFTPSSNFNVAAFLKNAGWDEKKNIISICPINPFWWPVKPDPERANKITSHLDEQYHGSVFFHQQSDDITKKYKSYLKALANSIDILKREHNYFPIIIGMERIDKPACEQLALLLDNRVPTYISGSVEIDTVVHLLRFSSFVLSSRFHALVLAMPGGAIPLGISMDERIANLLTDLGHPELVIQADDSCLEGKIISQVKQADNVLIRNKTQFFIQQQLKLIGEMGMLLVNEIKRFHPQFSLPELSKYWQSYLPPLSPELNAILMQ